MLTLRIHTISDVVANLFSESSISSRTVRAPSYRSSTSVATVTAQDTSARHLTSMSSDRARSRRERTFVGSVCAVCEEPLEHTLRGERILQFSCTHVSHEACFYEFIREFESQYCPTCNAPLHLDTSRGGNVLDIGKFLLYYRIGKTRCQTANSFPRKNRQSGAFSVCKRHSVDGCSNTHTRMG